jgi:hypothetical protein
MKNGKGLFCEKYVRKKKKDGNSHRNICSVKPLER